MADFPYKDPAEVRFKKPALFVRGSDSPYVPDETLPVVGGFFPRFELRDVKAGHWVTSENPEAFRAGESLSPPPPSFSFFSFSLFFFSSLGLLL